MTWTILVAALKKVLVAISPEIRELLVDFVGRLWDKAVVTPNVIDDMFVRLLAEALDISLSERAAPEVK